MTRPATGETNRWLVLVIVCLAQFMVILDATVVNVALPSIQRDLNFSAGDLQWVINSYTLVFGGFLLLGGRAGDLIGRRKVFLAGVAVFTFASLLNGLATSSTWLVAARALQGLGGALVSPAALSIITTTFAEGPDRTKALGVWSAIAAGGGAFGLLLGGVLTELLSWEWIFFVNVPIGIATAALALRYVPESRGTQRQDTADVAGAVSVTAGLIVLVYAIVKAPDFGWGSLETLGLAALAAALLIAFVMIEQRSPAPLIRLGIFRVRSIAGRQRGPAARRRRPVRVLLLLVAVRAADPGLLAARGGARVPADHVRDRRRRGPRPAGGQAVRGPHHRRGRDGHRVRRPLVHVQSVARRQLSGRRAARDHPHVDRDGAHVRPDHADRDDRRRQGRCGPGVGALQHLAAGRRRARPRRALHPRDQQDGGRARRLARPAAPGGAAVRARRGLQRRVPRGGGPRRGQRRGAARAPCASRTCPQIDPDAAPVPAA